MCLFDPVLAVLSTASGRLSFRDIYAEGGSGLGQVGYAWQNFEASSRV